MRLGVFLAMVVPTAAIAGATAASGGSEARTPDGNARCATRLALSLTGRVPDATLLAAADPQTQVDALLESAPFMEQFARFVNSKLNDEPGLKPADDAAYWLAKYILANHRPWHELFDGKYRVEPIAQTDGTGQTAQVVADPAGLGYFRSRNWMVRYAGNEAAGYRLSAAYRIQQNIIGLDVSAVTTSPNMDISATGREATECRGCHYDSYFALDKVARVLSKRVDHDGALPTFAPPTEGPQTVLDGHTIANDADLVAALVQSTDHKFRTCRLAFEFLYGRHEASCEAPLFDACVDAYSASGDVRDALRALATDPGYCE